MKNQSPEYGFYVHITHEIKSKMLKVSCSCFLNMLGFERRASQTPLYTSLHSIVSSPHFLLPQCTSFTAEHRDGASQGGRRRRWGGRGADEEGVKCLCTYKVESVSARKPKTNIQRIKVARQRMKARKKEQKGQQNR